jgi:hypothetical protein
MGTPTQAVSKTGAQVLAETQAALEAMRKENAEMLALIKANQAKAVDPDELELGITVPRLPGTKDAKDKGSKGGSLMIKLGKQQIFPSKSMFRAVVAKAADIESYIVTNDHKILR